MTTRQKNQLRLSEIRTKLSELGGLAELTDEQNAEIDGLRAEYQTAEKREQALAVADDTNEETVEETPDAEARALETLVEQANAGDVFCRGRGPPTGRGRYRRAAAAPRAGRQCPPALPPAYA